MPTPLYANLEQNRKALNQMFGQSTDFYAKPIRIRGVPCLPGTGHRCLNG